jgi:hypothetical protein
MLIRNGSQQLGDSPSEFHLRILYGYPTYFVPRPNLGLRYVTTAITLRHCKSDVLLQVFQLIVMVKVMELLL